MRKLMMLATLLAMMLLLVACEGTGDTFTDPNAAQQLQPNISGYETRSSDNVVDGFSTALGASAVASGNVPLAIAMERVNTTLECLENTGAVSGQIYIQEENVQVVPQGGTTVIVNLDRVQRNLFNCITQQPLSAQALAVEPCFETGTFTYNEDEFLYMYAGAGAQICSAFRVHFRDGLNATVTNVYP